MKLRDDLKRCNFGLNYGEFCARKYSIIDWFMLCNKLMIWAC